MRNNIVYGSEADVFKSITGGQKYDCSFLEEDMIDEPFYFINRGELRIPFYRVYLDSVESASVAKLCDLLRSVPEGARVLMYLNNPGGDLFNTMQIVNAMNDCPAEVIAIADGKVMSAASILFLSADKYIIKENAFMMCHYYSGGVFGKGHEMQSQLQFYDEINKDFMRKSYKGFLTDDEFERMTKGEDFWFSKNQIEERLCSMIEYDRANPSPPIVTELIGDHPEQEEDPLGGMTEDDIILLATEIKKNRAATKRRETAAAKKAAALAEEERKAAEAAELEKTRGRKTKRKTKSKKTT